MMLIIIIISFFSPPIHFIKRAVHFLPSLLPLLTPSSSFPLFPPAPSPVQLSGQWDCGTSPSSPSQVALLPAPLPLYPPTTPLLLFSCAPRRRLQPGQMFDTSGAVFARRSTGDLGRRRPRWAEEGEGGDRGGRARVAGKK